MIFQRICLLIAPVAIVLLFGSTLTGKDTLAFRDVSHFYLPLYEYVAQRTAQEWLPLWNPLDQTGIPLLGESTTAVLYPVRYLLFSLPITTAVAMAWYIVLHLVLASFAARFAAIRAGVSPAVATVSSVIYPLSGGVIFLYTNPPFLVGAAWLPFAISGLTGAKMSALRRTILASSALAMMILGGDPQTAFHAMLVVGVIWVFRWWKLPSDARDDLTAQLKAILVAPVLAACLSAPQLAASISWSSHSDRVLSKQTQDWKSPPAKGTQRHDVYQFSLPPWHATEILTSNPLGRLIPTNARISSLIPGDGRMWTPTIYCGLVYALALCCGLTSRGSKKGCWFWLSIVSLLLCLGHFGDVWVFQQVGLLHGWDSAIGGTVLVLASVVARLRFISISTEMVAGVFFGRQYLRRSVD